MDLTGKIISVLPARSGTSAKGEWKSQSFVIETKEQYPKRMVFDVFGDDKLKRFDIMVGDEGTVFFNVDAREYNNKWYNSITAYDFRKTAVGAY